MKPIKIVIGIGIALIAILLIITFNSDNEIYPFILSIVTMTLLLIVMLNGVRRK